MKKLLVVLLGAVFALNLLLAVSVIGECVSPKQAFYTVTDAMMNSAYRFRRSWSAKAIVL